MATLTLRNDKGFPLTLTEMDNNLENLNNQLPKSLSFSSGTLTLTKEDDNTITVDLDGRYLQSFTESDTLDSVTARGDTTTNDITVGNITANGNITATGDINSQSDARVKENVDTIDSALSKVEEMRGVYYNIIGNAERKVGVIAQEIEKVLPEIVREDDEGMKSVAYANITAILIEAVKELSEEVKELKSLNSK